MNDMKQATITQKSFLVPIFAYPVLFWYGLDLLSDFRRIREMNRELNSNLIYLN